MNTKEILQGIKNWTAGKLDTKVDKVTGKGLSTNDYTNAEKTKLAGIEEGAGMNLVEGYYYNKKFYKEAAHTTQITGAGGRIYIDKDTDRLYRWNGTEYTLLDVDDVLAQAFAILFAEIDGLKAQLDNLGETKAKCIDFEDMPKVCGQPLVIEGDGAPAAPVVPTMVGQRYHDKTNRKVYEAFAVTNNISDWVLIN